MSIAGERAASVPELATGECRVAAETERPVANSGNRAALACYQHLTRGSLLGAVGR
jgi:hypothetical protein